MFHRFVFFFSSVARSRYSSLFLLSFDFICGLPRRQSPLFGRSHFFCWLSLSWVVWPRLRDLLVSQIPRGLCASDSPRCIPVIILHLWEFSSPTLADFLSLEFEWQPVSSSFQVSSLYSSRSQQCSCLDCLHLILKSSRPLTKSLVTVRRERITIGITVTFTFQIF